MSFISILRVIILTLSLFSGAATLGLGVHWTLATTLLEDRLYDFEIVALAAGSLSTIILPIFLIVGTIRKNAFTSMIVVEYSLLVVLFVLWLVTAAMVAQWSELLYPFGCDDVFLTPYAVGYCQEFIAIEGLSFATWILLFIYSTLLLIFTLVGKSRGQKIWTTSVSEASFFGKPAPAVAEPLGSSTTVTQALTQQYDYPRAQAVPNGGVYTPQHLAAAPQSAPIPNYPQV